MGEALADRQLAPGGLLQRHEGTPGDEGALTVPVAAFITCAPDGPRVDRPPPMLGKHNEEILAELGYGVSVVAGFRSAKII
jgi:formyl-CoA transferase